MYFIIKSELFFFQYEKLIIVINCLEINIYETYNIQHLHYI